MGVENYFKFSLIGLTLIEHWKDINSTNMLVYKLFGLL